MKARNISFKAEMVVKSDNQEDFCKIYEYIRTKAVGIRQEKRFDFDMITIDEWSKTTGENCDEWPAKTTHAIFVTDEHVAKSKEFENGLDKVSKRGSDKTFISRAQKFCKKKLPQLFDMSSPIDAKGIITAIKKCKFDARKLMIKG